MSRRYSRGVRIHLASSDDARGTQWLRIMREGDQHPDSPSPLTEDVLRSAVAAFEGRDEDIQIDLGHGSMDAESPAVGWIDSLEVRQGDDGRAELWAHASFTEEMTAAIRRDEYRYLSPGWAELIKDGQVASLVIDHLAVTNKPLFSGLSRLAASQPHVAAVAAEGGAVTPEEMAAVIAALSASTGLESSEDLLAFLELHADAIGGLGEEPEAEPGGGEEAQAMAATIRTLQGRIGELEAERTARREAAEADAQAQAEAQADAAIAAGHSGDRAELVMLARTSQQLFDIATSHVFTARDRVASRQSPRRAAGQQVPTGEATDAEVKRYLASLTGNARALDQGYLGMGHKSPRKRFELIRRAIDEGAL